MASRPPISTHVLDTSLGQAAAGIEVELYRMVNENWVSVRKSVTNADGRCADLIETSSYAAGRFKLHFNVGQYFAATQTKTLYPFIEIVFDCTSDAGHYHIPVLLNPFGYTTYRGT